jgi:transposase
MPANIEIPLDLPEVRIVKTESSEQAIVITVESTREWTICARCGSETREFHSYGRLLRLRHLPILGRPVLIEIRPKRFRCPVCDDHPTTTQQLDWYDERSPHTKAYDQWLLLAVLGSTLSDVARKERTTYDSVLGALRRQLAATVKWEEIQQLEILGLDEIALKKGHRDFVVLITTRQADGQLKLLGVLPESAAGDSRGVSADDPAAPAGERARSLHGYVRGLYERGQTGHAASADRGGSFPCRESLPRRRRQAA